MTYINALMVVVALVLLARELNAFKRVTVHAIFLSLLGVGNAICVILAA
jgi:hypothetical protein